MKSIVTTVLFLGISILGSSQNVFQGLSPFKIYSDQDYDGHPQNWATAQDDKGIIYTGNTEGTWKFDGESLRSLNHIGATLKKIQKRIPLRFYKKLI